MSCKQCAYGKRGHAQTAAERFAVLAPSYDKPKHAAEDFATPRNWRVLTEWYPFETWNILRLLLLDEFLVVLFVHCVTIYWEMTHVFFRNGLGKAKYPQSQALQHLAPAKAKWLDRESRTAASTRSTYQSWIHQRQGDTATCLRSTPIGTCQL